MMYVSEGWSVLPVAVVVRFEVDSVLVFWSIRARKVAAVKREVESRSDGTSEGAIQEARMLPYHWR